MVARVTPRYPLLPLCIVCERVKTLFFFVLHSTKNCMTKPIINYSASFAKARELVHTWNLGHVKGITQTGHFTYNYSKALRPQHTHALFVMLRLYAESLNQEGELDLAPLPPFESNSPALAMVLGCCPRTVRNIISRLMKAGMIEGKVSPGRGKNYLLYFS